jgi:dihydrodipicolinate synthase/N-acetylneuraminate lyase
MSPNIQAGDLRGVFAMTPTPAVPGADRIDALDTVDLAETDRMIRRLISDGIDGIMTNGTLGEMATLTFEEWKVFAATVADAVRESAPDLPLFIGATAANTRDTVARMRVLKDLGVQGAFLGRPMWSALGPDALFEFYSGMAEMFPDTAIVLYDNPEAFKGPIPTAAYAKLAKLPQMVAAKYTTITPKFGGDMRAVGNGMLLMPIESDWFMAHTLFPDQALACWSSSALCGPEPALRLRELITSGETEQARLLTHRIEWSYDPLIARTNFPEFSKYNIALEKMRFDEAGYISAGPARPPYHVAPAEYLEGARENARRWRQIVAELAGDPAAPFAT